MKHLLILTLFASAASLSAQRYVEVFPVPPQPVPESISQVSKKKDTLWLLDIPIGRLVASTWEEYPLVGEKKPVILLVKTLPPSPRKKRRK